MTNNQLAKAGDKRPSAPIMAALNNETVKKKFFEVLGKKANGFISSLVGLTNSTPALKEADPKTMLTAAMTAATLDLPINPNLGFAYIVPYRNRGVQQAQFQMGFKGYIQLAMRTGQYKTMNVSEVHEGEIESIDTFTGDIVRGERQSDKVVGYVAYFRLVNGFEKYLYMTKEEVEAHGKKYSQAYRSGKDCLWRSNFDAMAKKTVLKLLISKFGIMSIEMRGMEKALQADQAVIGKNDEYEYVDNPRNEVIEEAVVVEEGKAANTETGEIVESVENPAQENSADADEAVLEAALDAAENKGDA